VADEQHAALELEPRGLGVAPVALGGGLLWKPCSSSRSSLLLDAGSTPSLPGMDGTHSPGRQQAQERTCGNQHKSRQVGRE